VLASSHSDPAAPVTASPGLPATMTAHPTGTTVALERWQDVDQEVAAGSGRGGKSVAEDGAEVETADSISREVGAGRASIATAVLFGHHL
jgi:hypothetical protein